MTRWRLGGVLVGFALGKLCPLVGVHPLELMGLLLLMLIILRRGGDSK